MTEEEKAKAKVHLDKHKKALGIGEFAEAQREPLKHVWPVKKVIREQNEQGEEVEEIEFEVAPEPTQNELIESVEEALDEVNQAIETINENFSSLQKRVEALEATAKSKEEPEEMQEQVGEQPERLKLIALRRRELFRITK